MDTQWMAFVFEKVSAAVSHPLTTAGGILVGVWGLIVSLRSRAQVSAVFTSTYREWLGNASKHEGLAITYKGSNVERIGSTDVVLWNAGNKTIREDDFSRQDQLRIKISGGARVFEITIAKTVPESLPVHLVLDAVDTGDFDIPYEVPIKFDFIDPMEGVRFRVVHDGGADLQVNLAGRLAGSKGLTRFSPTGFGDQFSSYWEKILMIQGAILFGLPGAYCIYRIATGEWSFMHAFGVILIAYWLLLPAMVSSKIRPKGLH